MEMILVFDTETTGMIDFKKPVSDPCQPRLVQFAGMVVENGRIIRSLSCIVQSVIDIPPEVSEIHGITTEFSKKFGVFPEKVCGWYFDAMETCDLVVAHNADFDLGIMDAQIYYLGHTPPRHPEVYDTMKKSTNLVKLKGKFGQYKWPKLIELYKFLFNEDFDGAHDAMEDVRATFRCYKKMVEIGIK